MHGDLLGGSLSSTVVSVGLVEDGRFVATAEPDPEDPAFAGHFPGFPLLPGVYTIDFVHRAVLMIEPDRGLVEVETCRLLRPIGPGEPLLIKATLRGPHCEAEVSVGGQAAAVVRLRYAAEESR
jgi:3-hydroxyacyl-[acyl-carrier-protein] dehydratase